MSDSPPVLLGTLIERWRTEEGLREISHADELEAALATLPQQDQWLKTVIRQLEIENATLREQLAALPPAPPQGQDHRLLQLKLAETIAERHGWKRDEIELGSWISRMLAASPPAQAQEQEEEITKLHNTCAYYEREIQRLKAALPPAHGWQPIETAPKDRLVWWWLAPKTADETYCDTSGKPILAEFTPFAQRTKHGHWSSLTKATHWHEDTIPVPPSLVPTEPRT